LLRRLILAPLAALALILGFAVPANAATWNLNQTGQNGQTAGTTALNGKVNNTSIGGLLQVCVTGQAIGGGEDVRVWSETFDVVIGTFGTANLTTRCNYTYNAWPGIISEVKVRPKSAGGSALYVQSVSIY
jgi:hypothetical protein